MAGLGMFAVIFGAVTAWSGWSGRNVLQVFQATLSGQPLPKAGNEPFADILGGFPGFIAAGLGKAVSSGIGGAIKNPGGIFQIPGIGPELPGLIP